MNRQTFNNDNNAFFALCSNTVDHTDNAKSNFFSLYKYLAQKDSAALPLVPKISECRWPRPQAAL